MRRYNTFGFTLLEVMVAIAIVAIVLAIGVPSFADAMRRSRVANATNELNGALALARSEAIKRGMRVTVCPAADQARTACADSTDWSGGLIIFGDELGDVGTVNTGTPGDVILQSVAGSTATRIGLTANRNFLSYRPSGAAEFSAGETLIVDVIPLGCTGEQRRTITVSATGRSQLKKVACP